MGNGYPGAGQFELRIKPNENRISLPVHQENRVFLFLDFSGRGLIFLEAVPRLAVDFLDHIPALQTRLLRRASPLYMGNEHTARLWPNVVLRPAFVIERLDPKLRQ